MNAIRRCLQISVVAAPCSADWGFADTHRTGCLVVAPDRGYLGNEEVQSIFQEFETSYAPASLALIGRDDNALHHGIEHPALLSCLPPSSTPQPVEWETKAFRPDGTVASSCAVPSTPP